MPSEINSRNRYLSYGPPSYVPRREVPARPQVVSYPISTPPKFKKPESPRPISFKTTTYNKPGQRTLPANRSFYDEYKKNERKRTSIVKLGIKTSILTTILEIILRITTNTSVIETVGKVIIECIKPKEEVKTPINEEEEKPSPIKKEKSEDTE